MKIQLALDAISADAAKQLVAEVNDQIDILEFGTPFLLTNGLAIIDEFRSQFPSLPLLADIKIMDGGEYLSTLAIDAGASYVTVLGVARDETIAGAIRACHGASALVLADLLASPDPARRAVELEDLGVDGVCVHTGFEPGAGRDQVAMLESVRSAVRSCAVSVAGGIGPTALPQILPYRPDIVVVGGSITGAAQPAAVLADLRRVAAESEASR